MADDMRMTKSLTHPTLVPGDAEFTEWDALSPEQQLARLEAEEAAAANSGEAPEETLAQRLKRVRTAG